MSRRKTWIRLSAAFALFVAVCAQFAIADPAKTFEIETPLDQAHADVLADHANIPAYYDLLVHSQLYIFAQQDDASPHADFTGFNLRVSKLNGVSVVNAFDTEERAIQFATPRGFGDESPIGMNGIAVFRLMTDDYAVLLNPETQLQKFFVPDEVRYVASLEGGVQLGAIQTSDLAACQLAELPEGDFKTALSQLVANDPDVFAVYVCVHPKVAALDGAPNYLVIVETPASKSTDADFQRVFAKLESHMAEIGIMDAALLSPETIQSLFDPSLKATFRRPSQ